MSKTISFYFTSLYEEFLHLLSNKGLAQQIYCIYPDKTPVVDFQIAIMKLGGIGPALELFSTLKSYEPLMEMVAEKKGLEIEKVKQASDYGIFVYLFSELNHYLTPPVISFGIQKKHNLVDLKLDDEKVFEAIVEAAGDHGVRKGDKYIVIFENLEIDRDVIINEDIKLIVLSKDDIEEKFRDRHDGLSNWSRVFSAFEVNKEILEDGTFIPILSTLIRMFKNGDVRYKTTLQKAEHFIRGNIYSGPGRIGSGEGYSEHTPNNTSSGWKQYKIKNEEIDGFQSFVALNLPKMLPMVHSCRSYNMIASSPPQLSIPLLFFVIESFFSDIKSEVVFRVGLYVTNILSENADFAKKMKTYYDIRSKVTHGDLAATQKLIKTLNKNGHIRFPNNQCASEHLDEIVKKLWRELLKLNWKPGDSFELISNYLYSEEGK